MLWIITLSVGIKYMQITLSQNRGLGKETCKELQVNYKQI